MDGPDPYEQHPDLQKVYTGHRGRPRYNLDLQWAIQLHNSGSTWESIADVFGVSEQGLYYQLEREGIPTARPQPTQVEDDDLDFIISEISTQHPMAGYRIVQVHLEFRGILISEKRVQESLRRVDAVGVLLRYAFFSILQRYS